MAKTQHYTGTTITEVIDGVQYELSPEHTPADWMEDATKVVKIGNVIILGYLCHDSDCMNPLEDCDGMGTIHHHPRSNYGRRDSGYYEALGLNQYGDPDVDLIDGSNVRDAYISYCIEMSSDGALFDRLYRNWDKEEDESDADFVARCAADDFDNGYGYYLFNEKLDELTLDEWKRMRDAGNIGDRDAVLLDMYEHSGVAFSVHGRGMQCRWDTSSGAAVWVPDEYSRQEIDHRAKVYAFGQVVKLKTKYHAIPTGTQELGVFDHWHEAFKALEEYSKVFVATPEMLAAGRYRAAEELAGQACETYTAWANGDCYGYVVEAHSIVGEDGETEFVEELGDCGGIVGGEWAEQELADQVNYWSANYKPQQAA